VHAEIRPAALALLVLGACGHSGNAGDGSTAPRVGDAGFIGVRESPDSGGSDADQDASLEAVDAEPGADASFDALPAADVAPVLDAAANADAAFPLPPFPAACGVALIDSFESQAEVDGWSCATWADATLDANGQPMPVSLGSAGVTDGQSALAVPVRFTGAGYHQGYVGRPTQLSLAGCASLALDVTLPADAPSGLRGSIILLLGTRAAWNGQADPVALTPGQTTTVRLPLAGAIDPIPARDLYLDVEGIGFKIDGSDVTYQGTIGIDDLRVEGLAAPTADDLGAFPVGTFGGFAADGGVQIPTRNGFLTFTADDQLQGHALVWPMLGDTGGDFVIGRAYFNGTAAAMSGPSLRFHDWSLLQATEDLGAGISASVLMSRAFPAARYSSNASNFTWATADAARSPMARLAFVDGGAIAIHRLDAESMVALGGMSEPWILLWAGSAAGWSFDAPTLLTLENAPTAALVSADGVELDFAATVGRVQVLPLGGLSRRTTAETVAWDTGLPQEVVEASRALVPILAAYPLSLSETYSIDEASGTVTISDTYTHETIADAWQTVPSPVATVPPAVFHAGQNGFPVEYPDGPPTESGVATWFGPFAYATAPMVRFTLPLAAGLNRSPVPMRVDGDPATAPIRAELERILGQDVSTEPGTFWLGNDECDADFLCDGWATLLPGSAEREKARVVGPRLAENTFLSRSSGAFQEPVTGQNYLAPIYYPEWSLPFDKEWNTGRQLAAMARCSEQIDLDVARGLWPKVLATYRYHRIFFDWATGSVLSSCLGINELADGMNFAWDGMLGVGRLARKLGDEATWQDVAYRTARQQAALYNAWFHGQWVKDLDYGVGHISNAKLPQNQVETRGAIDGYVEEYGAATLEFRSFWQTTNYLYFDLPVQLSLYRDYGLEDRVRALEYQIMPGQHPSWIDGDVMDPVDQRYYGSNYTAAHLVTRALLFYDDPATLFGYYSGTRGTQAAGQWYTMLWHGLAGPTLLSIERGHAPLLEAPIGAIRLAWSAWDAGAGTLSLDFQALRSGPAEFRTRTASGAFQLHPMSLDAGQRYSISLTP
jgi:hypothetical protein